MTHTPPALVAPPRSLARHVALAAARAVAVAAALSTVACHRAPRHEDFPSLAGHEPFGEVDPREIDRISLPDDLAPVGALPPRGVRPHLRVRLPLGFDAALPCDEPWQWAVDASTFVAIHRSQGAASGPSGSDVVLVVEQSDAMAAARKQAADAAIALLDALPPQANAALVTFGAAESERRRLTPAARRGELVGMLRDARVAPGVDLAAGLSAAEDLVTDEAGGATRERRVVLVAASTVGVRQAADVAARLARRGAHVDVVSVAGDRSLAEIAGAGQGQFRTGEAAARAAAGSCSSFARADTGTIDAWIIATALGPRGPKRNATLSQFVFLTRVEPALSDVDRLQGAALSLAKRYIDPTGSMLLSLAGPAAPAASAPAGAETGAGLPLDQPGLGLIGIGQRGRRDDFTGWRWVGANRHHAHLRLGSIPGTFAATRGALEASPRPSASAPQRLTDGTPTQVVLGYLGDGATDDEGLGVAMLCPRPTCSVATSFASFLATVRPSSPGPAPSTEGGGDLVKKLALAAGFVWLPLSSLPPIGLPSPR